MNGIPIKIVIDTNVIFMALYDSTSKAGKVIKAANKNKVHLFATDVVKVELTSLLKSKMMLTEDEVKIIIDALPIVWIEEKLYELALSETKVKHEADKPTEALAIISGCGILSADEHFENIEQKIDINDLLKQLEGI